MGDHSIGSTLAGYRIDALIARGGMGVVYRATHLGLERPVALKVIARELGGDDGFRERFLRESRLAASLDHPAVVPVFDSREVDGELVVAMRLVEGGDLKKLIDGEGPLRPTRAIELLGQVAEALNAAHAAGIVHRDVKPHNILVDGDRAYLSDFGLAKALGESGTASGTSIVGTVEYMAPEQWRGEAVGPAADVYSLGCVLYEALTGVVPYARSGSQPEPKMPRGLDAVIERAVAKDPADRYPSAGALIAAARECEAATPAETRVLFEGGERPTVPLREPGGPLKRLGGRRGWIAVGVIALVAVAVLAVVVFGGGDVSVSSPIAVGNAPLRLAAGRNSVWVTSSTDGTLSRIDPGTRELAGDPMRLGAGISGVAVGDGSVWVSSPRTGSVLRVDPNARRVLARIPVGGRPGAIVFGGDRIWVADDAGAGVAGINPARDAVFKQGIAPRVAPLRLAVGAGGVWASSFSTGTVRRIDLRTATAGAPIRVGRGPTGVTVAGGIVWVANSRSDTIARVDPATHLLLGDPVAVGERPGGIDSSTRTVWVANGGDDTVSRIDISGNVVGGPIKVGPDPGAIVVGAEAIWVADNGDGTVTRIEP